MRLILTRHGETIDNINNILQGWQPGKLSSLGVIQAKRIAQRLKNTKIDIIYSSDLQRALDTAIEISKFHSSASFIEEPRLRERCFGIYEGRPRNMKEWSEIPGNFIYKKPELGETLSEVQTRVSKFYDECLEIYPNKTILYVSHGGTLKLLAGHILGNTLKESWDLEKMSNAAYTKFDISNDKVELIKYNCIKHLK